jgi:hypothetical protein
MLSNRNIIAGGAAAVVVAGAFVALVSGGRSPTTPEPTAASSPTAPDPTAASPFDGAINQVSVIPRCTQGTGKVAIGIRRPTPRQLARGGTYHATVGGRPVATIVVRNVGVDDCRIAPGAFSLVIKDRRGKVVGEWDDPAWFAGIYRPSTVKQFSLPDVLRCDRPGPFVALAVVDSYTARRDKLSRREITC